MKAHKLSDKSKKAIEALYPKYEQRESALMPALYIVQDQFGYIPEDIVPELSQFMTLPQTRIEEVLSFYTMYHRKPTGKYHFQICRNLTCHMMGCQGLKNDIKKMIGVEKPKDVSADGLFSYEEVECLGSCDTAPVVMINEDYFESFDKDQATEFIHRVQHEGSSTDKADKEDKRNEST